MGLYKKQLIREKIQGKINEKFSSLEESLKQTDLYKALDGSEGIEALEKYVSFSEWYQKLDKKCEEFKEESRKTIIQFFV